MQVINELLKLPNNICVCVIIIIISLGNLFT